MTLHPFAKELQTHQIEGDETTNEEYKTHGGSFGVYFRNKQIKLDTQAKQAHVQNSQIFANCIIYITGYTVPSATELKRLIVENGGQVCAFLGGKSYATHVVATSLTSRKTELFANVKVVKPAWVTESVKLGKTLDWTRYRVIHAVGNAFFEADQTTKVTERVTEPASNIVEGDGGVKFTESLEEGDRKVPDTEQSDDFLLDTPGPEGDQARIAWILEKRQRVNCMDANFITDYFSKSRLHFLTTRKLELRKRCRQYTAKTNSKLHHLPVRRTILHVDFDSFFVAVALKKRPDLRDKPVCVSNGTDGSDIASCNYVARKSGVKNGMWVARAKSVCPDLICLPYEFEEYAACSNDLYDTLLALEPLYISAISVDEAILDISNLVSPEKQTPQALCIRIRQQIKELTQIEVSIGVGSNVLLAKLALKRAKPAGVYVMDDLNSLGEFSIRDLPGVGRHIESQLVDDLSVHTVQELQDLPMADIQASIGNVLGQKLYGYARGMDTSDVSIFDIPVKTVGLDIGWGVRVINDIEKSKFVDNCIKELWRRLVNFGTLMEQLTVKVYAKSDGAPFIAPKHLGHGLCDISSRSRKVSHKTSFEELRIIVAEMVKSLYCAPLNFRGIGLHMKVTESNSAITADPHQSRITDQQAQPKTPPSAMIKRTMIAVPPRKRRRGMTLTQMVPQSKHFHTEQLLNQRLGVNDISEIDMNVLAELPSQIRKEILLNEDDYQLADTTQSVIGQPMYKRARFLDVRSNEDLRNVLKQWVQSSKAPTNEDAASLWDYVSEAAKEDSSWVNVLDLCDWLSCLVNMYASHPDWHELCQLVDKRVQQILKDRL